MIDIINYIFLWGFILGSIYLGLSLGFSIIIGILRIFHMAYGVFPLLAIYFTWAFWRDLGLPLYMSLVLSIALSAAASMAFLFLIRRFFDAEDYLLVSLVTVFLIVEEVINHIYPEEVGVFLPLIIDRSRITIGQVSITAHYLYLALISLIIFVIYIIFFKWTKIGLIMRGVSQDTELSRLLGVNSILIYSAALGIAAIPISVVTLFYSPYISINPFMGASLFVYALQVAILGGLGNLRGTLIAAYLIGYIHAVVGFAIDPRAMNLVSLIVIILILLFRPRGIAKAETIW